MFNHKVQGTPIDVKSVYIFFFIIIESIDLCALVQVFQDFRKSLCVDKVAPGIIIT